MTEIQFSGLDGFNFVLLHNDYMCKEMASSDVEFIQLVRNTMNM